MSSNFFSAVRVLAVCCLLLMGLPPAAGFAQGFLSRQLEYERVRTAYDENKTAIEELLARSGLSSKVLRIYFRAFKHERSFEVWGSGASGQEYILIAEYPFCAFSGEPGPKRKEGDLQIPEGFYEIIHFNEESSFHLSLGLNYPNESDRILSHKTSPGSDIYIHGGCATVGCIPLTDPVIEIVYLLGVLAKNSGQGALPVHIYPFRFSSSQARGELASDPSNERHLEFWKSLEPAYFFFEEKKLPPRVSVDAESGSYYLKD